MVQKSAGKTLLLLAIALFVSCGDQSLFMSTKSTTTDLQITSITDGQVIANGGSVPLTITAQDTSKNRDVEIDVTLSASTGESVWHNRLAVTLNEQTGITLPNTLAAGLYKLDYVLYSAGEMVQKKSIMFFVAADGWQINGIKSFPPVITSAATVMLKADLAIPSDANPYLRWSWKGKSIAKGMLADGLDQILWVVPSDAGVYTVMLEVFPSAPSSGTDFSFTSSLALSTDVVVSSKTTAGKNDLGPDSSYLSLLHLQASLADTGAGAKKTGKMAALPIGSPQVVTLEDVFGYRLAGSTGIQVPWLALPTNAGVLQPFTVSLGASFDDLTTAASIVNASASDGSLTLAITMDPSAGGPSATLSAPGATPLVIPWSGPALSPKERYLLSLSIVPLGTSLTAQWFLDGAQVSAVSAQYTLPAVKQDGTVAIGGDKGFAGVVDEFGIYFQDGAGRPSPDPDLYARAQRKQLGSSLVLADGFDGIFLSSGFSLEGTGELSAGSLALQAGAGVSLPPIKLSGSALTLTAGLSADSSRSAKLVVAWEGSAQPAQTVPLTADTSGLRFTIAADGLSLQVPSGAGEKTVTLPASDNETANLLLTLENPSDAKSALVINQVLVVKEKQ
ncbi:MAG: hypothetical protein ABSF77_14345 [Spirochaetia bacterium]|jgi:hypothetical protein